ncbi:MAG: hypothetical protein BWY86_00938 [Candidatus Aminicenantes bacterium ADurb.Bin508]|nr:MAG: hypothetical protein BWY86_00938 [Candidatus Aminicenantes bacterium ADurb.Bin508]
MNSTAVVSGRVSVRRPCLQQKRLVRTRFPSRKTGSPGSGCSTLSESKGRKVSVPWASLISRFPSSLSTAWHPTGKRRLRETMLPMSTRGLTEGRAWPLKTLRSIPSAEGRKSPGFIPIPRKASRQERILGSSFRVSPVKVRRNVSSVSRKRAVTSERGEFFTPRATTTPRRKPGNLRKREPSRE